MYKTYIERLAAELSPKEARLLIRLARRVAMKRQAQESAAKKLRSTQRRDAANARIKKRRDEAARESSQQCMDMMAWIRYHQKPFTRKLIEKNRGKIFYNAPSRDRLRILFDQWVKEGLIVKGPPSNNQNSLWQSAP